LHHGIPPETKISNNRTVSVGICVFYSVGCLVISERPDTNKNEFKDTSLYQRRNLPGGAGSFRTLPIIAIPNQ